MLNLKNNAKTKLKLTEDQRRVYTTEKLLNFRWIAKVVATYSPYELSDNDLIPSSEINFIHEIGQFAEVVYGAIPIENLLANYDVMNQPKFPLEGYYALSPHKYNSYASPFCDPPSSRGTCTDLKLIKSFKGTVADLPVAVFSRWITETEPKDISSDHTLMRNQIIVSISGTSSVKLALYDLRAIRTVHPHTKTSFSPQPNKINTNLPAIHSGFWSLCQGIKHDVLQYLQEALLLPPPSSLETGGTVTIERELILTGHSLGAAVAHLLAIDLLSPLTPKSKSNTKPNSESAHSQSRSFSQLLNSLNCCCGHDVTPEQTFSKELQSISDIPRKPTTTESFLHKHSIKTFHIVTFGEPRAGNQALVDFWTHLKNQDESPYKIQINEWCVKAYNDGVPALPPAKLGYRHFVYQPLYTMNSKMYRVPSSEKEHTLFRVRNHPPTKDQTKPSSTSSPNDIISNNNTDNTLGNTTTTTDTNNLKQPTESTFLYPRGGHNYYNERDLEGLLRKTQWLIKSGFWSNKMKTIPNKTAGSELKIEMKDGWKERYLAFCSKN